MAGSLTHVPLRLTYDEQMRLCVVLLIAAALAFLFLPKGDKEQNPEPDHDVLSSLTCAFRRSFSRWRSASDRSSSMSPESASGGL